MNDQTLEVILNIINEWWEQEQTPDEAMNARVVLIYKKGDTSLCENYRPISLLNTCYKFIAAALQRRIETGIDHLLQEHSMDLEKIEVPEEESEKNEEQQDDPEIDTANQQHEEEKTDTV